MDRTFDDVRAALAEQHAELWGIIDGLDQAGFDRPSLCAGWSVADVLLHMAQTEEMAVASLEGRMADADTALTWAATEGVVADADDGDGSGGDGAPRELSVDDLAELAVQRERGQPGVRVAGRWWAASHRLEELLAEADPKERVTWVTGQLSVVSLATTRIAECWIHTGDIAEPLGVEQVPSERLRHVARLAWRTLPYAFAMAGRELQAPVAFHLTGPTGEEWRF
ncbi:MAG TPA: maleylpyruvate isomerase family mycothiol-dependent enzyme, partial [Acidimicrobiales bacterium]